MMVVRTDFFLWFRCFVFGYLCMLAFFLSVFLRPGATLPELTRLFSVGNAAQDLESFASHAGRRTIKTDDVMLLTRRNEGLETILKDFVEKLKVRNENAKRAEGAAGKKRKANGNRKAD
jgi:hypothetical protein